MNRLYSDIGHLLDEKFRMVYNLTYNTMATHEDVDTTMLRRALFNYVHCMFGIRYGCHRDSCVCALSCFSHVQLFEIPRIVALQAPLSMVFSRQEYWSGLPCPSPGDLPNPGIKPTSLSVSFICRQVLYYQRHLESHIETVLHVSKWKFWQESYLYPV